MTSRLLAIVIGGVRGWTRLYTVGLPADLRGARRQEIESDLWECQHDVSGPHGAQLAVRLIARWLKGAPADLLWRTEHVPGMRHPALVMGAAILALVVVGLALVSTHIVALPAVESPWLEEAPERIPPPPPPPPPPPRRHLDE